MALSQNSGDAIILAISLPASVSSLAKARKRARTAGGSWGRPGGLVGSVGVAVLPARLLGAGEGLVAGPVWLPEA